MTAFMSTLQAVHGTAPDPPCGEFDIEAVAEDGMRRRVPLASATRIPFADMTPARRIKARKGRHHRAQLSRHSTAPAQKAVSSQPSAGQDSMTGTPLRSYVVVLCRIVGGAKRRG